jgi:hypothetical protein
MILQLNIIIYVRIKSIKNKSFLKQLIKKRNRIEFYNLGGTRSEFFRIKQRDERRKYHVDEETSSEDDSSDGEDSSNYDTSAESSSVSDFADENLI